MSLRLTLLGLILLFSSIILKSQTEFAPIGAEWIFNYSFDGNTGYQRISVKGDTIIHNKTCKKLLWEKFFLDNATPEQGTNTLREGYRYIHQSRDTIFYYDDGIDEFTILFVFDVEVGDTILVPMSTKNWNYLSFLKTNLIFYTTSISNISIDGLENLKVIKTNPDCTRTDRFIQTNTFIERIGTTSFLFFNEIDCYTLRDDWSLRCYSDLEISYQVSQHPCDLITSSKAIKNANLFNIYPNPVSETLFIETKETIEYLLIFDTYGRLVKKLQPTSSISVMGFPKGIYWLEVFDNYHKRLVVSRFMVK